MKKKATFICALLVAFGTAGFADGIIPFAKHDEYMHQAMVSHWKATDEDMVSYIKAFTDDKTLIPDEFAINDLCKKTLEEWKIKCAKINYAKQVFSFAARLTISDYDFKTHSFSINDNFFDDGINVLLWGVDGPMRANIVNRPNAYSFKVDENIAKSVSKKMTELNRKLAVVFYFKIIEPTSKKYKSIVTSFCLNIELVSIDLIDPTDTSKVLQSQYIK